MKYKRGSLTPMDGIWLVSYIVLWAIVLALGLLVVLLYRQIGQQYLNTAQGVAGDGLKSNTLAPDFGALNQQGENLQMRSLLDGKRYLLLVFGSTTCQPCRRLLPDVQQFVTEHGDRVHALWINNRTSHEESVRYVAEMESVLPTVSSDDGSLMERYQVRVTPFVFLLNPNGKVLVKGLANTRQNLETYLREAEAGGSTAAPLAARLPTRFSRFSAV